MSRDNRFKAKAKAFDEKKHQLLIKFFGITAAPMFLRELEQGLCDLSHQPYLYEHLVEALHCR